MQYRSLMLLLSLAVLAGCETTIDPATGQTQTVWTLPLTQANAEMAEQQWQQCVQFASQSYCRRTLPDGRPPGMQPDSWSRDNDP
jgi:hypothetical protein